jgi:phosphate-selective porin OprO/OprP
VVASTFWSAATGRQFRAQAVGVAALCGVLAVAVPVTAQMQAPAAPDPVLYQSIGDRPGEETANEQPAEQASSPIQTAAQSTLPSEDAHPPQVAGTTQSTQFARRESPASSVPPLTLPAGNPVFAAPLSASPAQHFAEMADAEMLVPDDATQMASFQPSLSESGGEEGSLRRRAPGAVQREKNEPLSEEPDSLRRRGPGAVQRQKNEPLSEGTTPLRRRAAGAVQRQKNEPNASAATKEGFEHLVFGRIQADTVTIGQSPGNIAQVGHAPNGTGFRRARIGMQGTGYDIYFYRFEVDFSQVDQVVAQVPRITDAYAEIRQLPFGTLRMGEFRVPLSSERLMSANDLTFIERGLPQTFNPARELGLMMFNSTENYLASYFTDISTFQATNQGQQFGKAGRIDFTQRFVFLPWYDEPSGGRYLFHFGGAYQYQNARNSTVKYATTPEAVLTYFTTKNVIPNFIATPAINARDVQIAQVEASTVLGPLSIQGEYYGTWVNPTASAGSPFFFHGAYVYASYFLTGENRVYSRDQGYYTQVTPFTNFFRVRGADGNVMHGSGAWEIAARFSTMNLGDKSIHGGTLNDVTLGVNWYLTRQLKVMANYIYATNNVNNKQTYADIFETRAQVVW